MRPVPRHAGRELVGRALSGGAGAAVAGGGRTLPTIAELGRSVSFFCAELPRALLARLDDDAGGLGSSCQSHGTTVILWWVIRL